MKRSFCLGLIGLLAAALLSACSSVSNCKGTQPYMHAEQYAPLKNPPGLDVPPPNPDMAIPNVTDGPVGRYDKQGDDDAEDDFGDCLIAPPAMAQTGN